MTEQADEEFREFMASRWPGMVRLAYGLTGDQGHAEDLAQTAFAKAYASWARVSRTGNPDAYLRQICSTRTGTGSASAGSPNG
jgi:DNA-directed RNA polymerase specialized sigma24 family protein